MALSRSNGQWTELPAHPAAYIYEATVMATSTEILFLRKFGLYATETCMTVITLLMLSFNEAKFQPFVYAFRQPERGIGVGVILAHFKTCFISFFPFSEICLQP